MAKPRSIFNCSECDAQWPRWLGRCPDCGGWDTLVEERSGGSPSPRGLGNSNPLALATAKDAGQGAKPISKPKPLGEIEVDATPRFATGIAELDRVLGGGLVPGCVVLLGGEPGIGKSTLALQAAAAVQRGGARVLYVSGEESLEQIKLRADRLADIAPAIRVQCATRVETLAEPWRELAPDFVVMDSIQTMTCDSSESAAGSPSQVRESAALLSLMARNSGAALLLVGHVTKDGSLAGPRVLEHMVDVVLAFEGDRHHTFRLLRGSKNRFGSTQEVGVFGMESSGLVEIANPSELFLAERSGGAPGACIVPVLEGTRPMLVEIQALAAAATYGVPRRICSGIEDGRVALLLAVLDRRAGLDMLARDVYVNVAGGVRVGEPASDLGLCLAIASSLLDVALPPDTMACGEVGLGGEVRRVGRLDLRVPASQVSRDDAPGEAPKGDGGCRTVRIESVVDAVEWLRSEGTPVPVGSPSPTLERPRPPLNPPPDQPPARHSERP